MNSIRTFWRAFTRALAEASGNNVVHRSTIAVDMDTTAAELKLARLQARINDVRQQLIEVGREVDRIAWVHPGDRYQA